MVRADDDKDVIVKKELIIKPKSKSVLYTALTQPSPTFLPRSAEVRPWERSNFCSQAVLDVRKISVRTVDLPYDGRKFGSEG
jgi:hypothetical protein